MIKWIHSNKRSITVFLVASVAVFAMSIFGIDIPGSRGQRYAIKIGEDKITFDEFQKEKRQRQEMMIQQYKKILGNNFSQFADQIYNIPNQDIADDIIAKKLFQQEAEKMNLYVGEEQLTGFIKNQVFGGSVNTAVYTNYLNQTGQTAKSFQQMVKRELLIENYKNLLADAAQPSKQEIESFIKNKETLYDVSYLEFDPKNYVDKVKAEDAELEKYYTANQTDYEIPAKIQYNYTVLSPQNSLNLVEISAEDAAMYFSENESRYSEPEQVKARHIQINIPKDADKAKKDELKLKAEEAHSKASAGEKFDLLVSQYSEDFLTVSKQGDLGWIQKGKKGKSFDDAVFALKGPGVSPIISTDEAFFIVKVDEYKEQGTKKFEDVKAEIEAELKQREAPALLSAKAYEVFDAWDKSTKSLSEISSENKFSFSDGNKMISQDADPDPSLRGLTKKVIAAYNLKKQIVDLGDSTILVEVENYEESKIPAFAEAKEQVLKDYKEEKSVDLARQSSESFLEKAKTQEKFDMAALSKSENLKPEEKKGLSRAKQEQGVFANKLITDHIYSRSTADTKPERTLSVGGKYYVLLVNKVTPPDQKIISEKYETYKNQAEADSARTLIEANLNRLKATAEIDIDKTLLEQGTEIAAGV